MTVEANLAGESRGDSVGVETPLRREKCASDGISLTPRPPKLGIERRAIVRWMLIALLRWGTLLAVLVIAFAVWPSTFPWLVVPACATLVILLTTLFVEPFWRYRVHRWEITHRATYAVTGWFVTEWRVSPISRIQTVDAVRGPIEQLLGLSTLRVTTASSYGSVDIVGLDEETAREAVAKLSSLAEITLGDAT